MRPGNLETYGWNKIVRDLDRAFSLARLTGTQHALVQIARELSWSESAQRGEDAKSFELNASEIARLLESDRALVSKAKKGLIDSGIFAVHDGTKLIFNKDYTTWVYASGRQKGERLFSVSQLAHITRTRKKIKAMHRVENDTPTVSNSTHPPDLHRVENDTPPCEIPHTPCVEFDTPPVWNSTRSDPGAVIGTRASERFKRDLRERIQDPLHPPRGAVGAAEKLAGKSQSLERQSQLRELIEWHMSEHSGDMAFEHPQLSALLTVSKGNPEWVKEAIVEALAARASRPSQYATSILKKRVADPVAWAKEQADRLKAIAGKPRRREERFIEIPILTVPPLPEE